MSGNITQSLILSENNAYSLTEYAREYAFKGEHFNKMMAGEAGSREMIRGGRRGE